MGEANRVQPDIDTDGETRKGPAGRNNLWWGILLIILGSVFLLQRMGLLGRTFNWWALFIFIPAVGSLTSAIYAIQRSGHFNRAARSSLGGALVVGTVATLLMFDMDWSIWWPLMIIVPGFSVFLSGIPDPGETVHARVWSGLSIWIGLAAMLLGAGFLAQTRFGLNPQEFTGGYTWWALPILLVGLGGLINAVFMSLTGGGFNWSARGSLLIGLATLAVGIVAAVGASWNLVGPLVLIVTGLGFLVTGLLK